MTILGIATVNRRTLAAGQSRWDSMTPPEPAEAFLQTDAGDNWLYDATLALVAGEDLRLPSYPLERFLAASVEYPTLTDALAAHAIKRVEDGHDDQGALGQILATLADRGESDPLYRLLTQLLGRSEHPKRPGWTVAHDLADALLRPLGEHAGAHYRAQQAEDQE